MDHTGRGSDEPRPTAGMGQLPRGIPVYHRSADYDIGDGVGAVSNQYDYQTRMLQERLAAEQHFEREWTGSREHLHTVLAGAWLPALQAILTGVFLGVVVLVLAIVTHRPMPGLWGLIAIGVTTLAMWYTLLRRWLDLTAPIERVTGWDINRDGYIGEAVEPEVFEVRLTEQNDTNYPKTRIVEISSSKAKFRQLCQGLVAERPFSFDEWTGRGKLYTRDEFIKMRRGMQARDLLEWKNPSNHNQGMGLTTLGWNMVRYFAKFPVEQWATPTPLDGDVDVLPAPDTYE